MSARLGLPYQGSKNKIARWVIEQMPSATHFYDLCCGGCSVTHAAMLSGKYKYFHINDINPMWPQMFVDAINGRYRDERRIITRQDFKMWKDSDPYVALCWSFGNNAKDYLWGEDVEGMKLAACRMLLADTLSERRLLYKQFIKALKAYAGDARLTNLQSLESLERLQSLELQGLQVGAVTATSVSYTDVEVEPDAVVYCDIPYRDTRGYVEEGNFDHDAFYKWAAAAPWPVYISEYAMPDDFECIARRDSLSTLSSINNSKRVTEKIFLHRKWITTE